MTALQGMDGLAGHTLARRGFVMSSLISGFTLATTSVEAQAIHTNADGIEAGEIKIPVADGTLPGYSARPPGKGPFPIVLVNEEIFGVHEYIKDICRRLAKRGYLAVAPEIYARLGDLSTMTSISDIIVKVISKAADAQVMSDLDAALAWAETNYGDAGREAVTGFCRGGRNTWIYATHNPKLKAAVAWYGPVSGQASAIQPQNPQDVASELRCPLLGLYGGRDTGIAMAEVEQAASHARDAGKTVDIVVYPDAGHGFHADYRPSYNAADAADGWQRMLDWFKQYGVA